MELTQLLNSINAIQVTGEVQRQDVSGIHYDSRKVIKNSVFVAIKGYATDGHRFILDAINKGAIAIIIEDNASVPDDIFTHGKIAKILVKNSRIALAEISNAFYKNPSSKLKLIGITGTNGKTTTTYFIKSIFENAGLKTGLAGTIANYIGDREVKSSLTTPEANDMNEMLFEMINEDCKAAVMEVSSHSLMLQRVHSLKFAAGIFSNITSDHLDFHKDFSNYLTAKKILFDSLDADAVVVYNIDDEHSDELLKDTAAKRFSYGKMESADFMIKDIEYDLNGTRFKVIYKNTEYNLSTTLVGEFNAYNACAAFAVTVLLGISCEDAVKGIHSTKQVPGRMEVAGEGKKKVLVDYSHTADSLEKALLALKNIVRDTRPVYTVFGCGGNRDKTKRPLMGKIATGLSKKAFVTSDNPRNEDPIDIIKDIKAGIDTENFEVIENREEAIRKAIESTEDDAVILIAGKGHENYQEIKGIKNHFSDLEIAKKYLKSL
jgi:UDP-N-acetylmuramoyl-L-alanyl-D-glutamate--2,6-diaminopimelate ligase